MLYMHNFYNEPLVCEHVWIYELSGAACGCVCVCVCGSVGDWGGFVCDNYHWLGRGEGLWYLAAIDTLCCCWDSPQSHPLFLLSSHLSSRWFPGRFSAVVFHMQGVSGWLLQCDQHPPLFLLLLLLLLLPLSPSPPSLRSSSTLSPSSLFLSGLLLTFASPPLPSSPPPLLLSFWLHRSVWHAGGSWGLARLKGRAPRGRRRALTDKHHLPQTPELLRGATTPATAPQPGLASYIFTNVHIYTFNLSAGAVTSAYFESSLLICSGVKCQAYGSKHLPWERH